MLELPVPSRKLQTCYNSLEFEELHLMLETLARFLDIS